jgi:hypothetical protein
MRITDKHVFFWNGIYSQWYKAPMVIGKVEYNSCEQYMMHQKALLFEDIDDNQRIENLVRELRDYGFDPVDDIVVSNFEGGGIGVIKGPDALTEVKKKEPRVGIFIETIQSTMEDERIASLSIEELVSEFL